MLHPAADDPLHLCHGQRVRIYRLVSCQPLFHLGYGSLPERLLAAALPCFTVWSSKCWSAT
ncbi:MAG: hypothetical protein KAX65_04305 [Caldilineaceae bacterium]|nr:hypothetical protein [Caldilineaceae bacterium]